MRIKHNNRWIRGIEHLRSEYQGLVLAVISGKVGSMTVHDTPANQEFVTISRLSNDMGISLSTIYRWQRRGWLIGSLVGGRRIFTREQLRQFAERAATAEFSINGQTV